MPVGAIISPRDLEQFEEMEREKREKALAAFNDFGNAFRDVPDDELKREIASAIEESRVQLRAEQALAALGGVFKSAEDYNRAYADALARHAKSIEPRLSGRTRSDSKTIAMLRHFLFATTISEQIAA